MCFARAKRFFITETFDVPVDLEVSSLSKERFLRSGKLTRCESYGRKEQVMSDKFTFGSAGLIHELEMGMARAGDWDPALVKLLTSGDRLVHVREYLRGRAQFVPIQVEVSVPEELDTIIRVDRSIRPVYPDWVKTVMHPELEPTGLVEYDLSIIDPWLHDGQNNGRSMGGNKLYEYLKEQKMLESCLSLRDGEEIQKKGIAVFRKFFRGKAVFLWKSVVQDRHGYWYVPYLCEYGDQVILDWSCLDYDRRGNDPALRFAS